MSKYLILIYRDEAAEAQAAGEAISPRCREFMDTQAGALLGGAALESTSSATSIRGDGSGFVVTNGPFAESKEALGAYYLIEAADLDEALEIAKVVPAPHGGVEVRPVRVAS